MREGGKDMAFKCGFLFAFSSRCSAKRMRSNHVVKDDATYLANTPESHLARDSTSCHSLSKCRSLQREHTLQQSHHFTITVGAQD